MKRIVRFDWRQRPSLPVASTRTRQTPRNPLYTHVSGIGVINDSAKGEPVEYLEEEWSDTSLDLKQSRPRRDRCPRYRIPCTSDVVQ